MAGPLAAASPPEPDPVPPLQPAEELEILQAIRRAQRAIDRYLDALEELDQRRQKALHRLRGVTRPFRDRFPVDEEPLLVRVATSVACDIDLAREELDEMIANLRDATGQTVSAFAQQQLESQLSEQRLGLGSKRAAAAG